MLRWHTWDAQVLTSTFETHRCLPQAWLSSKYDLHVLTQSLQQLKRPAQGHRVCQWQSQESTNHRPCDIRAHSVIPGHQLPKLVNDGAGSRPGQPDSRAHAISITNGSGWAERLRPGHQPEQDGLLGTLSRLSPDLTGRPGAGEAFPELAFRHPPGQGPSCCQPGSWPP